MRTFYSITPLLYTILLNICLLLLLLKSLTFERRRHLKKKVITNSYICIFVKEVLQLLRESL